MFTPLSNPESTLEGVLCELEQWGLSRCPSEALARLEPIVEQLSNQFTDQRPEAFTDYFADPDWLTAYALFFAPQTAARVHDALCGILDRLPLTAPDRPLKILDLGCGIGTATQMAQAILRERLGVECEVTLVDWSASALTCAKAFLPQAKTIRANLRDFTPGEETYDLILSSFAFNEAFIDSHDARQAIRVLTDALASDAFPAFLLLLEPASRTATPRFLALREALRDRPLYAPCPHAERCPLVATQDGICHDVRRFRPTRSMTLLNRHLFRTISEVKYALLAFGRPGGAPAEGFQDAEFLRLIGPLEKGKGIITCRACMGDGAMRLLEIPSAPLSADRRHALLDNQRGDCAWLDGPLEHRKLLEGGKRQRVADLRFTHEPPPSFDEPTDDFAFSL